MRLRSCDADGGQGMGELVLHQRRDRHRPEIARRSEGSEAFIEQGLLVFSRRRRSSKKWSHVAQSSCAPQCECGRFDKPFVRDLVGDLGNVLMGEAAQEAPLKRLLKAGDRDQGGLGALVADNASDRFLDRWQNSHEPIITYPRPRS